MKFDPRTKILIVALISTLSVLMDNALLLACLLVVDLILGIMMKVNFPAFFRRAKHLLIVIITLTFIQSVFNREGVALLNVGGFAVLTDYGLNMGLKFILRMSIIISSALIIGTSSIREMTDGLIRIKIPYELAFMTGMALRFLPEFRKDFSDRLTALKLRGVDTASFSLKKKIKIYTYLLTPAVSSGILRSRMLAISMESRAFRAYKRRTMLRELRFLTADYLLAAVSLTAFIYAIYIIYF